MGLPPWEGSSSQYFVLVTGANSGLGFSICERLIDEFISAPSRDPKSHLVLIVTTRSVLKTRNTLTRLRYHLRQYAEKSTYAKGQSRRATAQGRHYDWRQTAWRVHFLGVEVDLCNLRDVFKAAGGIRGERGGIGSPDMLTSEGLRREDGKGLGLRGITIPRLDAVIMNAGIGGWLGLNWPLAVWTVLTDLPESVTWPTYKIAGVGVKISGLDGKRRPDNDDSDEMLGEVFCANLFGHYILGHELMPLLSQADGRPEGGRGRIIWISSIEALASSFNEFDFQGLKSIVPYESSKRLSDILTLTVNLPSVRRASETYFTVEDNPNQDGKSVESKSELRKPHIYLAHPGICATDIVPLNIILQWLMAVSFYLARLVGSVWHPISSYNGACAPVWAALAEQHVLDSMEHGGLEKGKWGSSANIWGELRVRRTEVGGWGWKGRVEEVGADDRRGRKSDAVDLTAEMREEFEALGGRCWREIERLRGVWERKLKLGIAQEQKPGD